MGQITIYLEEPVEKKLKQRAKRQGVSVSKWLSEVTRKALADTWPDEVRNLAGSWGSDFPSLQEIRSAKSKDIERESF